MPVDARTAPHLTVVSSNPEAVRQVGEDRLHLPPSSRLRRFVAAAALAGLEPADAVRLGLERALALADACALSIDVESARLLLRRAAAKARAARQLTPAQARYVRELGARQEKRVGDLEDGLVVALPDRVVTRARGELTELALHEGIVEEMVAWEIAATLEGRTMGEWALSTLAAGKRAA